MYLHVQMEHFIGDDTPVGQEIKERGYHVFENLAGIDTDHPLDLSSWVQCPPPGNANSQFATVNYTYAEPMVVELLQRAGQQLTWDKPYLTKYRISTGCSADSSNSTDAASLHRDRWECYEGETDAIFTLIVYFNKAQLQLVPGSHLERCVGSFRAISMMASDRDVIEVNPGDAVLFQSSMLHGGQFNGLKEQRTILQCFDVFPDSDSAAKGLKCMRHVAATEDDVATSRAVARIMNMPMIKSVMGIQAFIIQAGGNGFASGHRLTEELSIRQYSGEAWRPRLPEEQRSDKKFHRANLYVIYDPSKLMVDCDEEERKKVRKMMYIEIPMYYVGTEAVAATTVSIVLHQMLGFLV